jgi:peptidoglycan/xylan/chitin deacetylase (PgdA/CDA1 family)
MKGAQKFGGKREFVARGLKSCGALFLFDRLPAKDSLLVLNHHRIGNPEDALFDPGVFSATTEELEQQISVLKRQNALVTLEEAFAFAEGTSKDRTPRCRVLITFDDGYLDNYENAFPVLRSHGVQGVFFLCTDHVGSNYIPWWDRIAYLVKTAKQRQFTLRYPADLLIDLDHIGLDVSLRDILSLYKRPENTDGDRLVRELKDACRGVEPPGTQRRFLNWDEAAEMIRGGMAIGSHTRTHRVLSQLGPEKQLEELSGARAILQRKLGIQADALAYPVGAKTSFTATTEKLAQEVGYRAAFSHHGGVNLRAAMKRYDLKRVHVGSQSMDRFRVRAEVCRLTGKYWP